jgi:hypothetical protein
VSNGDESLQGVLVSSEEFKENLKKVKDQKAATLVLKEQRKKREKEEERIKKIAIKIAVENETITKYRCKKYSCQSNKNCKCKGKCGNHCACLSNKLPSTNDTNSNSPLQGPNMTT